MEKYRRKCSGLSSEPFHHRAKFATWQVFAILAELGLANLAAASAGSVEPETFFDTGNLVGSLPSGRRSAYRFSLIFGNPGKWRTISRKGASAQVRASS